MAVHRVGAGALLLAAVLSFCLATVASASVPGTGATLTVSPGEGPVAQPFTAIYTGGQHCSGEGWSEAIFYLDGAEVGTAARQSGCEASLEVAPDGLSPVPGPGPHLVTASLVTPGGTMAVTGLTATYVITPTAGGPPPSPSPGATPTPTASPSPAGTPTPSGFPSPSPAATPTPSPPPSSSPPSGSGPPGPGSVSAGPPSAVTGDGVFPGAPAAIGALPGPIVAISVGAPHPGTAPVLPRPSGWALVPFALGLLGLLLLYGVARLSRAPGAG